MSYYSTEMEYEDNCTSILSRAEVLDIQSQQDQIYIIINGIVIIKDNTLDVYVELHKIVSEMDRDIDIIDVWLSHVPCPACVNYLEWIFYSFPVKPFLHFESLQYDGFSYEMLRELGCLAKLKTGEFHLAAWDWGAFSIINGGVCQYYLTAQDNTDYLKRKEYTKTLLEFLNRSFTASTITNLCTP